MENNKLSLIDKFILLYFVLELFFVRWLIGKSFISLVAIVLFLISIVRKKSHFKIKWADIIVVYLFFSVVLVNILSNGIKPLLIKNLYVQGIAEIIVIIYICILGYERKEGLKKFIVTDLFMLFNIYFIINIPILIKQLGNTFFLMRNTDSNPFYEDHITGLIGASGTHELTFFWILLILINMYRYSIKKEKIILLFNAAYVIFMIIISSQNDNTAFFVIFPIIILEYFFKDIFNSKRIIVNLTKIILGIIISGSVVTLLYYQNTNVNKFINTRVIDKLYQYGVISDQSSLEDKNVSNDEERVTLYKYALKNGNGYKLGMGIGSISSYGDPSLPDHFGMSEISLRTYEGGIIYLVSYILIFSYFLYRIFKINENTSSFISFLIISIDITLFSIYTLIFRIGFFAYAMSLIVFIFSNQYNKKEITAQKKEVYDEKK